MECRLDSLPDDVLRHVCKYLQIIGKKVLTIFFIVYPRSYRAFKYSFLPDLVTEFQVIFDPATMKQDFEVTCEHHLATLRFVNPNVAKVHKVHAWDLFWSLPICTVQNFVHDVFLSFTRVQAEMFLFVIFHPLYIFMAGASLPVMRKCAERLHHILPWNWNLLRFYTWAEIKCDGDPTNWLAHCIKYFFTTKDSKMLCGHTYHLILRHDFHIYAKLYQSPSLCDFTLTDYDNRKIDLMSALITARSDVPSVLWPHLFEQNNTV